MPGDAAARAGPHLRLVQIDALADLGLFFFFFFLGGGGGGDWGMIYLYLYHLLLFVCFFFFVGGGGGCGVRSDLRLRPPNCETGAFWFNVGVGNLGWHCAFEG